MFLPSRHEFTNYDDAETYVYDSAIGLEWRSKMENCGASVSTCTDPVTYPIYTRRTVKREARETQKCPICTKDEYISTKTNDWIMTSGHDKCASDPASDLGSAI